jgi:hypothetical protein
MLYRRSHRPTLVTRLSLFSRLRNNFAVFHDDHGAKLVDSEWPPVETVPSLTEKRRPGRIQPDRNGGRE